MVTTSGFSTRVTGDAPWRAREGAGPRGIPAGRRGRRASGDPVEIAAAGLAVEQGVLLPQLLQALRRHGHVTAAAEVRLGHLDDRDAAVAEDLVVVGEDDRLQLARQLTALAPDDGEIGLDTPELLRERCFLRAAFRLPGLEATLGLLHVQRRALLLFHEAQDLLFDPSL